jgi:tetrapyrrole methylase family protein/MazG family protein
MVLKENIHLNKEEQYTFQELADIIEVLRRECPWDKEQTLESMKKYLIDESQEVFEAVSNKDMDNLCEELGDVLLQVLLYSQIASETGSFTIHDVVDGISRKMIRRHPHVFGDEKVTTKEEGLALWESVKKREKDM